MYFSSYKILKRKRKEDSTVWKMGLLEAHKIGKKDDMRGKPKSTRSGIIRDFYL